MQVNVLWCKLSKSSDTADVFHSPMQPWSWWRTCSMAKCGSWIRSNGLQLNFLSIFVVWSYDFDAELYWWREANTMDKACEAKASLCGRSSSCTAPTVVASTPPKLEKQNCRFHLAKSAAITCLRPSQKTHTHTHCTHFRTCLHKTRHEFKIDM